MQFWRLLHSACYIVSFALLFGCGSNAILSSPPVIKPITPARPSAVSVIGFTNPVPAGSPGFSAIVNGSGFTGTSVVYFNGVALTTNYQTDSILFASVPAALLVQPGDVTILVKDPASGTTSNPFASAVLSSAAATASVVALVSSAPNGTPANGDSLVQPSLSATGRFVVFQSAATNLVPQSIITPWENIYLSDTCAGVSSGCTPSTQLVTISADGTTGGNFQSRNSSVSADGRFVAFDSGATNLLASSPAYCTNSANCVYLRDTCIGAPSPCTPSTVLASVLPGEQGSSGALPVLSPSARYLTFDSNQTGLPQVYLRDLCIGITACTPSTNIISANSAGALSNEGSKPESLSGDGRFVSFLSYSTNLIDVNAPATQTAGMLYVRDTCLGITTPCSPGVTRVDVPNNGGSANQGLDFEIIPSLSATGRYIAYSSDATNLVSSDVEGFGNVYVRDTCLSVSTCVAQNSLASIGNDGAIGNSGSHQQTMSADGRFIAFTSIAGNLVWGDAYPAGEFQDIYVRDTCTGAAGTCFPSTVRVAVAIGTGLQVVSNAGASFPVISADGHYVAFLSTSTNLTSAGTGGHAQTFLSKTGF